MPTDSHCRMYTAFNTFVQHIFEWGKPIVDWIIIAQWPKANFLFQNVHLELISPICGQMARFNFFLNVQPFQRKLDYCCL